MTENGTRPVGNAPAPLPAAWRGFRNRCPACGEGRLFGRFLKVRERCEACDLPLHHHRADDFPPYIVMFVVGHLVGYGLYATEMHLDGIPLWFHALLWPALALTLCLALLQPVKGAVVGLQYGLGMHGFRPGTGAGRGWAERSSGSGQGRGAAEPVRRGGAEPGLAEPGS